MAELKGANRFDYEVVKLMRLTGADNMLLQFLEIGLRAGAAQMAEEDPAFPSEEFIERIQQRVDPDTIIYQMAPIYSKYYTREEIAELISFYDTPLGRKLVKELAQITQELIAANQEWAERLAEKIGNDFDSLS
jgi:hypothetical protein